MRRLRSRLIAAFLGVACMAMIPLAIVSYYTTQVRNEKVRRQFIENTLKDIENYINYQSNIPTEVLFPLSQWLQKRFPFRQDLLDLLEYSDSLDDAAVRDGLNWWEKQLWNEVLSSNVPGANLLLQLSPQLLKFNLNSMRKYPQYPIQIIPKQIYLQMKEWLDDGLFYEENGKIYCYKVQEIFKGEKREEQELVGALFCPILLIEKYPGEPNRSPDIFLQSKRYDSQLLVMNPNPQIFEKYLSEEQMDRLFGILPHREYRNVNLDKIEIGANDYNWPPQFRITTSGVKSDSQIVLPSEESTTAPLQMKLVPIMNHRRELAAILVLSVPIISIIGTIGNSLLVGYGISLVIIISAAILFSRTISRPIMELADAARQMAEGDFGVRVQAKGMEEHRILSFAFNQLASRIQVQLKQLREKARELEASNRELSQTQHFLENILSNIRTGVMSIDRTGRIGHINAVGENMLHADNWNQKKITDVISCASFLNPITYSLRQGVSIQENEVPYELQNGEIIPMQVSIVPVLEANELNGLVVTFHDLSAIRQLEEQIRRQDRLVALGRMAAGVAHEIRNPLGIIRGSAELLRNRFAGQQGEEELANFILEEVHRLSRVVNDFLLFARPPEPHFDEVPVERLFDEMVEYFNKQPMEGAYELITEAGESPSIAADLHLCRQVFLNLFINAQQAMPAGGRIILRATALSAQEVAVEVEDEGAGIHPDQIDKIFDPFYTSKDSGSGLGLSLVHQIAASHGGRVEVDSVLGKGSRFRLIFQTYESFLRRGSLEAPASSYTGGA
ncbi:MAG: HAMP domain-containing protein [Candidatus Omnitrophica bacterium]|nr:HAMP domain-containing protein [Candidatus Omnitrophota bacterium]